MFNRIKKSRAQSTLEYAILIGVIVAGLIAMQTYLKRGYQGKLRESADSMGDQFSPGYTTYNYTTHSYTDSNESVANAASTTLINNQYTNKSGDESVLGLGNEYWFTK